MFNNYFKSALIITIVFSLSMTGCTKMSETFSETSASTPRESETSVEEGLVAKAESHMREFITAVNLQKYEGIASLIYMPENALISDKNIEWYVARTALADITGISIDQYDITVSDGALKKDVIAKVNNTEFALTMELDNNNNWKIVLPELYVENWSLKVPRGCQVSVNSTNVDTYKVPATVLDTYDTYTFSAVALQEMMVIATSDIFGDFTQKITPVADSESVPVICKISDAETASVLKQIQSVWNALYTDYKNGVEVTAISKYFTEDFDSTEMTKILFAYFPSLEKSSKDKEIYFTSFYMKETIPWTKDNYGCAILSSNDTVLVNFGYRIDFASSDGGAYNANKASQITMSYDSAASTYKIKKVNDAALFFDNDYSLNDY